MDPITISLIAAIPQLASLTVNWIQERRYQTDNTDAQEASNMQSFIDYLREQQHQTLITTLQDQTETLDRIEALATSDISDIELALELLSNSTQTVIEQNLELREAQDRIEAMCRSIENHMTSNTLITGSEVMKIRDHIDANEHDMAIEAIDKLVSRLEQDNTMLASFLMHKAMIIFANGELDASVAAFEEAHHADPSNDTLWEGLATFYYQLGKSTESMFYFNKCIESDNLELKARSLNNKGAILLPKDQIRQAWECHLEALDINKSINCINQQAHCHFNLATICYQKGHIEDAKGFLTEAIRTADLVEPEEDETKAGAQLLEARILIQTCTSEALDKALNTWSICSNLTKISNPSLLPRCLTLIAECHILEDRPNEAIPPLSSALEMFKVLPPLPLEQLQAHNFLAQSYLSLQSYSESHQQLKLATKIAEQTSRNETLIQLYSCSLILTENYLHLPADSVKYATLLSEHPDISDHPEEFEQARQYLAKT